MIQSLLFFETVEDRKGHYNETRVKLADSERPALEFIVRSNS